MNTANTGAPPCAPPDFNPRKPRLTLPKLACDTHAHILGPIAQHAYSPARVYTPPDCLLGDYQKMLTTLGVERAVLVQPSVYGSDNTVMLDAMRAAYDGKWYHTLTFVQKTTFHRPDGVQEQTWYETLTHTAAGTKLRIDFGDLSAGNGIIFTPDSAFPVRGGKPNPPRGTGNGRSMHGSGKWPVSRCSKRRKPRSAPGTAVSRDRVGGQQARGGHCRRVPARAALGWDVGGVRAGAP